MAGLNHTELWKKVEKTNPIYTKRANVKGNRITSIAPQYQILCATEQFGPYGKEWGFRTIEYDYKLVPEFGLVTLHAEFVYPGGSFPISNSISLYIDNARTKIDDNFAKKLETDALTKALSKLGFNADIFMGKFDDVRYVNAITQEFNKAAVKPEAKAQTTPATQTPAKQEPAKKQYLSKANFEKVLATDNPENVTKTIQMYSVAPKALTKAQHKALTDHYNNLIKKTG